jgi:1-deoxy-D-xylulose-5-phosphate synthase
MVHAPADLRLLAPEQLAALAGRIREFLVESVSRTGGHLGSNLAAVELTIAVHRVFDSPRDPIVWDTGHQAYVHKILTGRAGMFDSLRRLEGLSLRMPARGGIAAGWDERAEDTGDAKAAEDRTAGARHWEASKTGSRS